MFVRILFPEIARSPSSLPLRAVQNQMAWVRKSVLNISSSGKFSSDRTIAEYARQIWGMEPQRYVAPCPSLPRPVVEPTTRRTSVKYRPLESIEQLMPNRQVTE